jgi:hypothetical protein
MGLLTYFIATRKDIETTLLRTPGMLYQQQENNRVSNMYNFEVVNKTFYEQQVSVELAEPAGATLKMVDRESSQLSLGEDEIITGSFFILLDKSAIKQNNIPAKVNIYSNGKLIEVLKTNFVGPVTN